MVSREEIEQVDEGIHELIYPINSPAEGKTIREITRWIFGYSENAPSTEGFYNHAKLVERRMGAIRHRIFEGIRQQMREKDPADIVRPNFIPYAIQIEKYWRYMNAANYRYMPTVIEGLRHKADGLNSNAEVLEAVF